MPKSEVRRLTEQLQQLDREQQTLDEQKSVLRKKLDEEQRKSIDSVITRLLARDRYNNKIEVGDEVHFITPGKSELRSGVVTKVTRHTTTVYNKNYNNPVGWRRNQNVRITKKKDEQQS